MLKNIVNVIMIIFLLQGIALADYYKWEDENGVTHITDYPPPHSSSTKNIQVHENQTGTNNYTPKNTNEQKSSKSSDFSAGQFTGSQKQVPPPYNCIKICLEDNRNARNTCRGDINEYHNCMTKNHEQLKNCRQKCKEEEKAVKGTEKNNFETFGSKNKSVGTSMPPLQSLTIDLIDKRDPAEREGYPYPKSWFSYKMHGDRSLNVDRLSILKTKLLERFGSILKGKRIILTKFSVMEATVKPSFYKTPSGKQIPNPGPAVPTLMSEITLAVDDHYFSGSNTLPLRQGSKSTTSALSLATTMAVDDLLKNMEGGKSFWNPRKLK